MASGSIWQGHTGAPLEVWDLWFPGAASTGLPFGRGRMESTDVLWVHAAPDTLTVTVRDGDDRVVARGEQLRRAGEALPLTRLARSGAAVTRADRWPTQDDLGSLVMLPGGEVGRLTAWWHAADGSEWRWQVEFYNHR